MYVYCQLQVTIGEDEHYIKYVAEVPGQTDLKEWADNEAKTCYGDLDERQDDPDRGYYFSSGTKFVQVYDVKEIGKGEYQVLRKYL